jgi:tetratricopeptide (TPR) repeat protein
MNQEIATGYLGLGDHDQFQEYTRRTARFLESLPYSEELRPAYGHVATMCAYDRKDISEAERWLETLESHAARYHDLRALGDAHYSAAGILDHSGDSPGAASRLHKALETFDKIDDAKQKAWCLSRLADIYLSLGDLPRATECVRSGLESAQKDKSGGAMASTHWLLGQIRMCEGAWDEAVDSVEQAVRLFAEVEDRWGQGRAVYALGRILMLQGNGAAALERYRAAIEQVDLDLLSQDTLFFASVLAAIEEAYGDTEAFQALCARWRAEHPPLAASPLGQWYLKPAPIDVEAFSPDAAFRDEFADVLSEDWLWHDPMDDCWFRVRQGLEVRAANRRALWHINLSAPRVLHAASGDLAVQTVCRRVSDQSVADLPASGGLLIWADEENYLRLDVGTGGGREVFLGGCVRNVDLVAGRGRLPEADSVDVPSGAPDSLPTGQVHLRLERIGERVRALCSVDGVQWFLVGQLAFDVPDSLHVGLYANGNIDRLIYAGAYPEGTGMRFGSFELWSGVG